MKLRGDGFDVWLFRRRDAGAEFLVLRASQSKADAWFGGQPFWQVPSDFVGERSAREAISAEASALGLLVRSAWAVEHSYAIYNNRYRDVVHITVFAAEVEGDAVTLGAGHSSSRWVSGDEAAALVEFRGLRGGLRWTRHFITDRETPMPQLKID